MQLCPQQEEAGTEAWSRSKCFKYAHHFVFGCISHLPAADARTMKDPGEDIAARSHKGGSTRTTHVTAKVKSLPSMFAFQVSLLAGSSFCSARRCCTDVLDRMTGILEAGCLIQEYGAAAVAFSALAAASHSGTTLSEI